jgi:2-amino-4-hydroxy-6-hydroxymethyldihydropteridine diphosphokinase
MRAAGLTRAHDAGTFPRCQRMRDIAYIALGSNLGDRAAHLAAARLALGALSHSRVLAASSVEETAPLGPVPQRPYLNQMVAVETTLTPRELLDALLTIERAEGRVRTEKWGARTLDLDIVTFAEQRVRDLDLIVPHPELPNRDFWRRELAELGGCV